MVESVTRKQLSLYVSGELSAEIESIRRIVDPIQYGLIPAHVTLCREDELLSLHRVQENLSNIPFNALEMGFGKPQYFNGHGIMMPCVAGEHEFCKLRQWILASTTIRRQIPHITLAHPRNPQTADNTLGNAAALSKGVKLAFDHIHLIEQDVGEPWKVIETYKLSGSHSDNQ